MLRLRHGEARLPLELLRLLEGGRRGERRDGGTAIERRILARCLIRLSDGTPKDCRRLSAMATYCGAPCKEARRA